MSISYTGSGQGLEVEQTGASLGCKESLVSIAALGKIPSGKGEVRCIHLQWVWPHLPPEMIRTLNCAPRR